MKFAYDIIKKPIITERSMAATSDKKYVFEVAPSAGKNLFGDAAIGEYFRVFVSYAVITVALVMYEAKKRKENRTLGQQLAIEQKAEEEGKTV